MKSPVVPGWQCGCLSSTYFSRSGVGAPPSEDTYFPHIVDSGGVVDRDRPVQWDSGAVFGEDFAILFSERSTARPEHSVTVSL